MKGSSHDAKAREPEWLREEYASTATEQATNGEMRHTKPAFGDDHRTDLGNARRLVRRHGKDLRYLHTSKSWLVWDGKRFRPDDTAQAVRRAKDTVRGIYIEAASLEDEQERKAMGKHAHACESEKKIQAMLTSASSEPEIAVTPEALNTQLYRLTVANGTLDLRTGKLLPHQRSDLSTMLAPLEYHPDAKCPAWHGFLAKVLVDADLIAFMKRWFGYCLTGNTGEEKMCFYYGLGRNGKDTMVHAQNGVLGDYAKTGEFTSFVARKDRSGPREDIARLRHARFVSAIESESNQWLSEALIKAVTGGGIVAPRHLYGATFEYKPTWKLVLAGNKKPRIWGRDEGIWSRVMLVPFSVVIPQKERIKDFYELHLRPELPGILSWAVEGCLEWQRRGLDPPPCVLNATAQYREEQDVLADFLADKCEVGPDLESLASPLYVAYQSWCEANGEKPQGSRHFHTMLEERGLKRVEPRPRDGVTFRGIRRRGTPS